MTEQIIILKAQLSDALIRITQLEAENFGLKGELENAELRIKELEENNQALQLRLNNVHHDKPRSPMCG